MQMDEGRGGVIKGVEVCREGTGSRNVGRWERWRRESVKKLRKWRGRNRRVGSGGKGRGG